MMTSAQVVETSITVTDNSPFQDFPHPDDHATRSRIVNIDKKKEKQKNNCKDITRYVTVAEIMLYVRLFSIKVCG